MTKTEFENRINEQVTDATFDFANRVYMAAYNVGKDDFCKDWKTSDLNCNTVAALTEMVENLQGTVKNYAGQIERLEASRGHFTNKMVDFLIIQAEKWSASDLRDKAIELVGFKAYLRIKIELGFNLWKADLDELAKMLDN